MSFNNRRGGMQQQNNLGNIGRRRPPLSNNFTPGGQLTPQKGGVQQQGFNNKATPQANRPQQQTNTPQRPPLQQNSQPMQTRNTPQKNPQQQQQAAKPQQPVKPQQPQQPVQPQPPVQPQQPVQTSQPVQQQQPLKPDLDETMSSVASENGMSLEGEKKKWMMRKIPKRERVKKRNMRLGKLLQPKNALMVLNEIVMNSSYEVVDHKSDDDTSYKATVVVEGVEHVGYGKSKNNAKNSAAEAALKYLVKTKKMLKLLTEDAVEKMDTSEGETPEPSLPWQQVASFALFKLFDSWGESSMVMDENPAKELKPAKKLPDNAETLNPLMVVNQMYPNAQFEELAKTGTPLNYVFNVKCTIDGQTFTGSGPTKKLAKRNVSYIICSTLLGVKYPKQEEPVTVAV